MWVLKTVGNSDIVLVHTGINDLSNDSNEPQIDSLYKTF